MAVTRASVVRIGNSRGVRIPKHLIDQVGLGSEVEITVSEDGLLLRPVAHVRRGWAEQFQAMAERGGDRLLDEPVPNNWDADEWEW